jgi:hypothetical protein
MRQPVERATSAVEALAGRLGRRWLNIDACAATAEKERDGLTDRLVAESLVPADCAAIVFGSLARNEATPGSDIDWTLLVDGQADPQHVAIVHGIRRCIDGLNKKPSGPTAVFGGHAISHDLIHQIGGEADSNRNTTRRILLLLESRALVDFGDVRERVMRHIFRRYLEEDRGYHEVHGLKVRVPRFLLNDVVRFWRTMAVDYAAKRRDRGNEGWALRNFKLRLSRKLIFTAGLAMCLSCELRPSPALRAAETADEFYEQLADFLMDFCNRTPLEVLASFASEFDAFETAGDIFDAYDQFLAILREADKRTALEKMDVDDTAADPLFKETRNIGTAFQDGLSKLFFATDDDLTKATQRYGVF